MSAKLQGLKRRHRAVLVPSLLGVALSATAVYAGSMPLIGGISSALASAGKALSADGTGRGGGNNGNGVGNGPTPPANPPAKTFTISGVIAEGSGRELAPGVPRTLLLTLKNDNKQAIKVTSLKVNAVDDPNCDADLLLIGTPAAPGSGSISTDVRIAANGVATDVPFPITLSAEATDDCQGVKWALTYSGQAVQA
jgi:hypothetical protein